MARTKGENERMKEKRTYELSTTHNGHYTQGLHAVLLGVKAWRMLLISKDDIWVDVGIQVFDAELGHLILECGDTLTRGVIRALARGVVGPITVNIHVSVFVLCRVVHENGVGDVIAVLEGLAAGVTVGEALSQNIRAFSLGAP